MSDPARDDRDRLIGEVLASRYQIESLLGEGAMGAVYKARHVKVGRPFAVKILHKKLLEDKKVAQRFEREAELAGRLRHPNVIGVVDVGETPDGTRYMVMDFAEGDDLATLLAEAPMHPERVISLTRQILEGLYHAHEAGLIHRDLKPENVIVERDDHGTEVPRLVDFGIAILREGDPSGAGGRLTTNGLVLGTPHYMAPEQAVADPIDHRIDLFALGIVVYEMLCGKLPFDGTGAEVARANLLLDPPAIATRVPYLDVDPLLEAFARLLMAKKREARPATAKLARELLDLITHDRPAAATALGVPQTAARLETPTAPAAPLQPMTDAPSGDLSIAVEPAARADHRGAAPPPPVVREPGVATATAKPLRYSDDQLPRRRRRGVFVMLGSALAIGGIVIALLLSRSEHAPAAPVAVTPPPPPEVVTPTPTATPTENISATGSAALASGSDDEIAMPADPLPAKPGPVTPGKLPGKLPGKKPGTPGPVGGPATGHVARPVPPTEKPIETPIPAMSARTVAERYRRVGAQITALQQALGSNAAADLWTRYRRIRIQQAVSTPALLQDVDRTLAQLETDIRTRSK